MTPKQAAAAIMKRVEVYSEDLACEISSFLPPSAEARRIERYVQGIPARVEALLEAERSGGRERRR